MTRTALILLLLGMALAPASASAATETYDWVAGFGAAPDANPSGPWTYMQTVNTTSDDPAGFRALPGFWANGPQNVWTTTGPGGQWRYPNVFAYPTLGYGYMHPAVNGLAVVRWTAPHAGKASVAGMVSDAGRGCGNGIRWSLNRGRTVLAGGKIEEGGPSQVVAASGVDVADGGRIYLIVDADKHQDCDTTMVDLVITLDDGDGDADGVPDDEDDCSGTPEGTEVAGDGCADPDGDGISTEAGDNCPADGNPSQEDGDGDGEGDECDADDDGDGVADGSDECAGTPAGTAVAADGCADPDGDGVSTDAGDNCPELANPEQTDTDGAGDGGDACDADDDEDGAGDEADNCPLVANAAQRDDDGDGIGDACDATFESTLGKSTGGGHLMSAAGKVAFSVSARSGAGRMEGACAVSAGSTRITCLDVTAYHQSGTRAVIIGTASVGGVATRYRIEITDNGEPGRNDRIDISTDSGFAAAGTIAAGNLQVHG